MIDTSSDSPADVRSRPITVVYIIGAGRSGSTLLGNILGEVDGFFHAGDLVRIWKFGVRRDTACGCGATVRSCPLWLDVLDRACPGLLDDEERIERLASLQRAMTRTRQTFWLLRPSATARSPAAEDYAALTRGLYRAIADVTVCPLHRRFV